MSVLPWHIENGATFWICGRSRSAADQWRSTDERGDFMYPEI